MAQIAQMTKTEIDAAFAEWWEKYWRKVGKQDARKAYGYLMTIHTPQFLLEKLEQDYARWRPTEDWQRWRCLLHPATWLNGRRWEDEVPAKANGRVAPAWEPPKVETCGKCRNGWIEGTLGHEDYCDCVLGDTLRRQIEMREA
jgi:hypothetical protein